MALGNGGVAVVEMARAKAPEVERVVSLMSRQLEQLQAEYQTVTTRRTEAAMARQLESQDQFERFEVLEHAAEGATVLLNVPWPENEVWDRLSVEVQRALGEHKARLFVIDAAGVAEKAGLERRSNKGMQV